MSEAKYMNKQDILNAVYELGKSQGLYSRLSKSLNDLKGTDPEKYEQYMEHLQQQHFKDPVDLVLYFEC